MRTSLILSVLAGGISLLASPLAAQSAVFVYRLGKDTVAVEQFTRTADRFVGEMVQRGPTSVIRLSQEVVLGKDGRPTSATFRRFQADGTPAPGVSGNRFLFTADSTIREVIFTDSVQRRAFPVRGVLYVPTYAYGLTELLYALRKNGSVDSLPSIGLAGNPGFTGLASVGGDAYRLRGSPYPMLLRFDATGRLQSVDGGETTNKILATRTAGNLDMGALARTMKPTGALSGRDVARATFGAGGIVLVDYGRPMVRERTVWGGRLVPFDSVWRAGANDATHLFTTRTLTMGELTVPPGMYSLFVQHTRAGTFLIVNRQTGQWGTQYNAAQDLGRVALQMASTPEHIEEFTIAVRSLGGNRGVLELSWGPSLASVPFTATVQR